MEWSDCVSKLQRYLENSPLIVLGSGASTDYGLPSMGDLTPKIMESDTVKLDPKYGDFCKAAESDIGLEGAIDKVALQPKTLQEIRNVVWDAVNKSDLLYFDQHPMEPPKALVALIKKVIDPTPNKAVIVTTNYDRLAEYAVDGVGATAVTGFEGELIKKLELPTEPLNKRRLRARERVVDIWKVHGSLDWFRASDGAEEAIVSFPLTRFIPDGFQPLIVPPGKNKYSSTHNEPYRTIISEADKAFMHAESFFCVGYGFNDDHIQPKLLEQISNGKPIVILAKKVTPACRAHIIEAGISKYLIFENVDDKYTKVYGNGWENKYKGQYWSLDNFLEIW